MGLPRNLPNLITGARLALAAVLLTLLTGIQHARAGAGPLAWLAGAEESLLLNLAGAIFVTAAVTDVLDGHVARRWGLTTDLGRIVDPFADKVIVCGTFVQLVPLEGSQVSSWMVVLILARELLVDGLRAFAESRGVAFPAMASGKLKMLLQSVTLGTLLFVMANLSDAAWALGLGRALLWSTVAVTLYSGGVYLAHARRALASASQQSDASAER